MNVDTIDEKSPIKIVDIRKSSLKDSRDKNFHNWKNNPKHLYIGSKIPQIKGTFDSPYRITVPFKGDRTKSLQKYYDQWKGCDLSELLNYNELGCTCHNRDTIPNSIEECICHGDVLLYILFSLIMFGGFYISTLLMIKIDDALEKIDSTAKAS